MRTLIYSILSVTLLFGFSGCSSTGKMPNPFSSVKQEPRRSVAVWSPAARVVNGIPERGFAARVTFFGADPKKGVKVDGDIVVFAFDEYPGRSAGNNAPDKTYPILAEDLKKLQSHSKKLGYSYSLWVPWDNDGPEGDRKTVSLMVKLVQKNGNTVMSGQAKCLLPGKEPVIYANRFHQEGAISQVDGQFGRDDRFNEQLPPGFRDWTKQDMSVVTPEERQIRVTNRPTQMVKTSIPIPNNTYSAIMQNSPSVNPVEMITTQTPPTPQVEAPLAIPQYPQYAMEPSPIMGVSYNAQPNAANSSGQAPLPPQSVVPKFEAPALPNLGPTPTDVVPPNNVSGTQQPPERVEQQGNTTVTYFNGPRTTTGTNPLALNR